jgi:hypothetical protein
MGMSPDEFAGMTLFDFDLKCEGFKRKIKNEESMFRKVAWFSMAPHLGKNAPSIERLWPMEGDGRTVLLTKKQMKANIAIYKARREALLQKTINPN